VTRKEVSGPLLVLMSELEKVTRHGFHLPIRQRHAGMPQVQHATKYTPKRGHGEFKPLLEGKDGDDNDGEADVVECGLDVQKLLPPGTPWEIRDHINRCRDVLARPFGNGLILAPTNTITPDVPFENLRAMFEACHGG
jgi:hypothetical protein